MSDSASSLGQADSDSARHSPAARWTLAIVTVATRIVGTDLTADGMTPVRPQKAGVGGAGVESADGAGSGGGCSIERISSWATSTTSSDSLASPELFFAATASPSMTMQ